MNLERLAEEFIKRKKMQEDLAKQVQDLKEMIAREVDALGTPDENGHIRYEVGPYSFTRQKRQGDKFLDVQKATEWAKSNHFWDLVHVTREELSEDLLLGYIYERRKVQPELAKELDDLYVTPPATWATMTPVLQEKTYDY